MMIFISEFNDLPMLNDVLVSTIFLGILIIFGLIIYISITQIDLRFDYSYHKEVTIKNLKSFGYADFNEFKKQFDNDKRKWTRDINYLEAFFEYETISDHKCMVSQVENGIVFFNNKGMVFSSLKEFKKFRSFIKKNKYKYEETDSVNWKN